MRFKKYILVFTLLLQLTTFQSYSQSFREANRAAHNRELANNKRVLDKSVLQDAILNEIMGREDSYDLSRLSPEEARLVADIMTEAKSHLGKRYVYGSKGPNTFDCSGFSGYVFKQFGITIGACSRDQYKTGLPVELDQIRPGDLVFFTSRNSKGGVGHVGIVIEADNKNKSFKFIHASTNRGVRIDSNEGYYAQRYVGAKRVTHL